MDPKSILSPRYCAYCDSWISGPWVSVCVECFLQRRHAGWALKEVVEFGGDVGDSIWDRAGVCGGCLEA